LRSFPRERMFFVALSTRTWLVSLPINGIYFFRELPEAEAKDKALGQNFPNCFSWEWTACLDLSLQWSEHWVH
jgi:hypothetical protein